MDIMSILSAAQIGSQLLDMGNQHAKDNASHESIQNALEYLKETGQYPDALYNRNSAIAENFMPMTTALYGDTNTVAGQLRDARAGLNGVSPYEAGTFDYTKDISDFYDPAFQLSVDNANQSINESQALGGNLFSSDTAQKIAAQNQVLASQMYNEALDAYRTDKSLEQGIWAGNEAAKQAQANSQANLAKAKYDIASDNAANINNAYMNYYDALMGLNEDYFGNKADYDSAVAGLMTQDPGRNMGILSDINGIFGLKGPDFGLDRFDGGILGGFFGL